MNGSGDMDGRSIIANQQPRTPYKLNKFRKRSRPDKSDAPVSPDVSTIDLASCDSARVPQTTMCQP